LESSKLEKIFIKVLLIQTFLESILALLGANLPMANIAKGFGIPKTLRAYHFLLKFFEIQKLFFKKVFGGVWGKAPQNPFPKEDYRD